MSVAAPRSHTGTAGSVSRSGWMTSPRRSSFLPDVEPVGFPPRPSAPPSRRWCRWDRACPSSRPSQTRGRRQKSASFAACSWPAPRTISLRKPLRRPSLFHGKHLFHVKQRDDRPSRSLSRLPGRLYPCSTLLRESSSRPLPHWTGRSRVAGRSREPSPFLVPPVGPRGLPPRGPPRGSPRRRPSEWRPSLVEASADESPLPRATSHPSGTPSP